MLFDHRSGLFQLDSIISLSLFLIYTVWLLFFVKNYNFSSPSESLFIPDLSSLYWSVNKIPIFIQTGQRFPVFVELPEDFNLSYEHTVLVDSFNSSQAPFGISDSFIVFLSSGSDAYSLVNSEFNYPKTIFKQVVGNRFYLSTQSIRCEFNNSVPKEMFSSQGLVFENLSLYANDRRLMFDNSSLAMSKSFSCINSSNGGIDNFCYVFGDFNGISCIAVSQSPKVFGLNFVLNNFSFFYSNRNDFGYLNESLDSCLNFSTTHILLQSKSKNLSFEILFPAANVSLCVNKSSSTIFIKSNYRKSFEYIFYVYPYSDVFGVQNFSFPDTNAKMGSVSVMTGLDPYLITNKSFLKSWFSDRFSENFGLSIFFNGTIYYVNPSPAEEDVFSKTKNLPVLMPNGSFSHALITIRGWSSNG